MNSLNIEEFEAPVAAPEIGLDDFVAHLPSNSFIYMKTREAWPAVSVNSQIRPIVEGRDTIPAATWLSRNHGVEQMIWWPGEPIIVTGKLFADGGWLKSEHSRCLNIYKAPPTQEGGDPSMASRWVDHALKVYPDDANHLLNWLAYKVQFPARKINHALVLGGSPGVGKDTLLEPVKTCLGGWNFVDVTPRQVAGRFNEHLKSVIMRVSEVHDLGDLNRYGFYELMKPIVAAPPDTLRIDGKHTKEYSILNCVGVIYTTNNKDGLYLPEDDRRHFVAWSNLTKEAFPEGYWNVLWDWYGKGGYAHVAAYLAARDLSGFDPKAPPRKTDAFYAMANMNRPQEDIELVDILERLGNPDAMTIEQLMQAANRDNVDFGLWLQDRRNRRSIPHRLERCGMTSVRNPHRKDGLWIVHGSRCAVYGKASLSPHAEFAAATALSETGHGDSAVF